MIRLGGCGKQMISFVSPVRNEMSRTFCDPGSSIVFFRCLRLKRAAYRHPADLDLDLSMVCQWKQETMHKGMQCCCPVAVRFRSQLEFCSWLAWLSGLRFSFHPFVGRADEQSLTHRGCVSRLVSSSSAHPHDFETGSLIMRQLASCRTRGCRLASQNVSTSAFAQRWSATLAFAAARAFAASVLAHHIPGTGDVDGSAALLSHLRRPGHPGLGHYLPA